MVLPGASILFPDRKWCSYCARWEESFGKSSAPPKSPNMLFNYELLIHDCYPELSVANMLAMIVFWLIETFLNAYFYDFIASQIPARWIKQKFIANPSSVLRIYSLEAD